MSPLRRVFVCVALTFVLGACGAAGMQGGPPPPGAGPTAMEPAAHAAPACDKSKCDAFCSAMQVCLYESNKGACMAVCEERCGDGYFDTDDAAVMTCVDRAGPTVDCSAERGCCDQEFTNQLCAP